MAVRTLGELRPPKFRLAPRRLRAFERPQQYRYDDQGDDEARQQVRSVVHRGVEQRIPSFGEGGREEGDARDEVTDKAGQNRDDGARDGAPDGGREEAGEPQNAEGQRVVEDHLHRVHDERLDGQIEEAVRRPRDDPDERSLAQG
jgi:hypothetical protein